LTDEGGHRGAVQELQEWLDTHYKDLRMRYANCQEDKNTDLAEIMLAAMFETNFWLEGNYLHLIFKEFRPCFKYIKKGNNLAKGLKKKLEKL
jgi:hypothetical protein